MKLSRLHRWFHPTGEGGTPCFGACSVLSWRKAGPWKERLEKVAGACRWVMAPSSSRSASFTPHNQPTRENDHPAPLQVKAPVLGHRVSTGTPSPDCQTRATAGVIRVSRAGAPSRGWAQWELGAAERGLSHSCLHPHDLVPSPGVTQRERPLRHEAGKGMAAVGPGWGGSPRHPQPGLSCFPSFLHSLASPLCSLCPPTFRASSPSPRMHQLPPTMGPFHTLFSLPRSPSWSLWLFLTFSDHLSLHRHSSCPRNTGRMI